MKFKLPLIEPLLIMANNGEWVHPNIELLTLNFEEDSFGNLSGPILKLDLLFENGKQFSVIVLTTSEGIIDMMQEEEIQNYLEMLIVALGEDVWCPGNYRPFVFTKYGETFNDYYPLFVETYKVIVTPDIRLNHDEIDWWWDI
jgi:hypothetical protein